MGSVGVGGSLTYQESVDFTIDPISGAFLLDLLDSSSLGTGFDSATFKILLNGGLIESQSFDNLASAESFFSNNVIDFALAAGINDVQLAFDATMSGGEGFGFDYAVGSLSPTPLPSSWSMMALGIAGFGLIVYRQQRRKAAEA